MYLRIAYLVATGAFVVMMLASAVAYLADYPEMVAALRHLGYPDYFRVVLGSAKVLGVLALVIPRTPTLLREWAYAGFAITMVSAVISHAASGDPAARTAAPLVALVLLVLSRTLARSGDRVQCGGQVAPVGE
jgi:hypothetical protein